VKTGAGESQPASSDAKAGPVTEVRNGICVLGMHRTGTSLVAGMLGILGMELGPDEDMMPATQDNPKGYWEQSSITNLNDALLEAFGGTWDAPPQLPAGWETSPHLEPMRSTAKAALHERFAEAKVWGWKDPRNSLTLPFWQRLVPGLRYVICVRNPIDVAESLRAREGEDPPIEHHLGNWLRYTASALEHTSGRPRLVLLFEDLLRDPDRTLRALAKFAGQESQLRRSTVKKRMNEFRDPSLAYAHSGTLGAMEDPRVSNQASALYLGLRVLAKPSGGGEEVHPEEWRALDRLAVSLSESFEADLERDRSLSELQSRSAEQEQALAGATHRAAELEALVAEQSTRLDRDSAQLAHHISRVADLERLGDAQRALTEDQRARLTEQRSLILEQHRRIETVERQAQDAELRLEAQAQVAVAQSRELQARDQYLSGVREEIRSVEESLSWRITRPLRWIKSRLGRSATP
jgi:hypothetical protein